MELILLVYSLMEVDMKGADVWEVTAENSPVLTEAELSLVNFYRALPPDKQKLIMNLAFQMVMGESK